MSRSPRCEDIEILRNVIAVAVNGLGGRASAKRVAEAARREAATIVCSHRVTGDFDIRQYCGAADFAEDA